MNRKQIDIAVGVLVAGILTVGVLSAVQLSLTDGAAMGGTGPTPAMAVVGPILMSLVVASIVGGVYVFVRSKVFAAAGDGTVPATTGPDSDDAAEPDGTADLDDPTDGATAETTDGDRSDSETRRQLLDVLPEDERRVLEPVLESPGLTQIEMRDRSGFSKSKVSQTVTDLEKRGLLYRERQGRTYRVYPDDDVDERV